MEMIIIQYSCVNPKHGKMQHYLKEITYAVYLYTYVNLFKSGLINNLEILDL